MRIYQRALGGAAMRDILSQGRDREPSPGPRRAAVVAALLLVTVVLVWQLPRGRHAPARPARSAVTARPVPLPSSGSPAPGLADEPNGLIRQALPRRGSLRLPATGEHPAWCLPATRRVQPIGGLPRAT